MNDTFKFLAATALGFMMVAGVASQELPYAHPMHDLNDPNHWYPVSCCSQQDCDEAEIVRDTPEGRWVRQKKLGKEALVPNDMEKQPSKDGKYHVCIISDPETGTWVRCWFEPALFYKDPR